MYSQEEDDDNSPMGSAMSAVPMGSPMRVESHPAYNVPQATEHYAGDVVPLHKPGTFSKNTDSGDIINGVAERMGMKPPKNVIKFPSK